MLSSTSGFCEFKKKKCYYKPNGEIKMCDKYTAYLGDSKKFKTSTFLLKSEIWWNYEEHSEIQDLLKKVDLENLMFDVKLVYEYSLPMGGARKVKKPISLDAFKLSPVHAKDGGRDGLGYLWLDFKHTENPTFFSYPKVSLQFKSTRDLKAQIFVETFC